MNRTTIPWDDVQWFIAVADHGSLKAAARATGISQPTLGRRMEALEAAVGTPLLVRTTRGTELTAAGERLLPHARAMADEAAGILRLREELLRGPDGRIRLACGALVAAYLFHHWNAFFDGLEFELELVAGNSFVALERGEADLAIRSKLPEGEHWIQRKLKGQGRFAIFGTSALAKRWKRAVDKHRSGAPLDAAVPFIGSSPSAPSGRWQSRHGVVPRVRVSDSMLVLRAAEAGLGLAILPAFCDQLSDLRKVGEDLDDLVLQGHVVMHPDASRRRLVRRVARRIADRMFTGGR
ncbi:MAG: LysR family transcriptional regulator [Myxococcota bacterium]